VRLDFRKHVQAFSVRSRAPFGLLPFGAANNAAHNKASLVVTQPAMLAQLSDSAFAGVLRSEENRFFESMVALLRPADVFCGVESQHLQRLVLLCRRLQCSQGQVGVPAQCAGSSV
jgi:hypothetical protein